MLRPGHVCRLRDLQRCHLRCISHLPGGHDLRIGADMSLVLDVRRNDDLPRHNDLRSVVNYLPGILNLCRHDNLLRPNLLRNPHLPRRRVDVRPSGHMQQQSHL